MNATKGYYCLIQFCPDPSRAEAVNIGVLLFCPERRFIDAKTSSDNKRIERFFLRGSFNPFEVNEAKRALKDRLEVERDRFRELADLNEFISTRANNIILTAPRVVRVENPESDLAQLFDELVGKVTPREPRIPTLPELDQTFNRLASARGVQLNQSFTVPVMQRTIRVPYAYQNGVLNLVRPEVFSADKGRAQQLASFLTVEGTFIAMGQKARLIVVSAESDPAVARHAEEQVAPVFDAFDVKFVRRDQVADFAKSVEREVRAHKD